MIVGVETERSEGNRTVEPWTGAVGAAVAFVAAQPGGPARLLAQHVAQDNGVCAGCAFRVVEWPCVAASIAAAAARRAG